jgi:beta-lactam-binding protein with PASTA domain
MLKAGCRLGRVTRTFSAKVKAGRVVAQAPAPRRKLKPRARVRVVVSKGRTR